MLFSLQGFGEGCKRMTCVLSRCLVSYPQYFRLKQRHRVICCLEQFPTDLLLGGCGSQTTGGTLKGLNMRMLGKCWLRMRLTRSKLYVKAFCLIANIFHSPCRVLGPKLYIIYIFFELWLVMEGNGGKGDDFPRSMVRSGENPKQNHLISGRFPQEGLEDPLLSPVVHQYDQVTGILRPLKTFKNCFGTSSDMIILQIERGARFFKYTYYVTFPGTHLLILGCPVTWTKLLCM